MSTKRNCFCEVFLSTFCTANRNKKDVEYQAQLSSKIRKFWVILVLSTDLIMQIGHHKEFQS